MKYAILVLSVMTCIYSVLMIYAWGDNRELEGFEKCVEIIEDKLQ